MLHGLFDNSESFSGLAPLLPSSYCYIALDLPGHGRSTHFPKTTASNFLDYVIALRLTIRFLTESALTIIGHSFGSKLAAVYSQLYPNEISRLVLIDPSYLTYRPIKAFRNDYRNYMKQACNLLQETKTTSTQSYEKGFQNFMRKRLYGGMTRQAAEKLYKRSIIELDGEYHTLTDPLTKLGICIFVNASASSHMWKKCPIICPTLNIFGLRSTVPIEYKEILTKILGMNRRGVTKFVDGGHHVHSDSPDIVAPLICDFLSLKCNL
ncbi:serine hydrolase-like protein isoform X2 [Photinus pyralis]|nr:serine hydrolase-like protein isoform X2 [Photinus pyralis]